MVWISAEPPHDLIPIGIIEPTAEEQAIDCWAWGGWASITLPPLTQWRWDHEREAVLAEDAIKRQKQLEARQQAQKEREQRRKRTTLDDLRKHQFFRNWKGHPPAKAIRASRKVMKSTVEELFKLGPLASENQRLAVLQQCIESFNALDSEMHFIATIEREDICEEFEAIVDACGLGAHKDLADEWREW